MGKLDKLRKLAEGINFVKTVSRPLSPLISDLTTSPVADEKAYSRILGYRFCYPNEICISGDYYDDTAILAQERAYIEKGLERNKYYLDERAALGGRLGEELLTFSRRTLRLNSDKLSTNEIRGVFRKYLEKVTAFVPYFTFTITAGDYLEALVVDRVAKTFGEKGAKETAIKLTTPSRTNLQYEEQVEFLKIARRYVAGEDTHSLLLRHLSRYASIGFRWGSGPLWSLKDLQIRLREMKDVGGEYEELKRNRERIRDEFRKVVKRMKPDAAFLRVVDTAKKYVWLRTYRSDTLNYSYAHLSALLKRLAENESYQGGDYLFFSIEDILSGKFPSTSELKRRKELFAVIFIGGFKYYLSGGEAKDFQSFLDGRRVFGNKVRGTVASRPVVSLRGVVKVINSPRDFDRVNEGDIIVATMTTPDYVPVMKKAAGFITDEGGILCHAAIISREMNKPCIVGSQNATTLLKDGDLVEMNLETGEVRKV
jgi:phosphohistidine swiveling domain-containing protein